MHKIRPIIARLVELRVVGTLFNIMPFVVARLFLSYESTSIYAVATSGFVNFYVVMVGVIATLVLIAYLVWVMMDEAYEELRSWAMICWVEELDGNVVLHRHYPVA